MNKYILLIVLLFLVSGRIAAQSVTVDAKIDSLQILIGEQAKVQLQVAMDGNAGVCRTYLHVEVRVGDGVSDLLERTSGGKHRKGGRKRDLSGSGKTRGDGHHVALGNAAVKKAVGELLFENACLCGGGEVGIQNHKIVFVAEFGKCVTVCLAGGDLFNHFCHFLDLHQLRDARISALACAYSASFGAFPCHPTWFSIKETPLPLTE